MATDAKAAADGEEGSDAELRDRLQAMEKRLSKLRDVRANHHEAANRSADQRNNIQAQYKEQREKLDARLAQVAEIRARIKQHKERRNSIQAQMKELFGRQRFRRDDEKAGRSVAAEYNKMKAEVEAIEIRLETSGTISLEKEKGLVKKVKEMHRRLAELEPNLEQQEKIKIDLGDIEGTIARMKQEADESHKLMLSAVDEANEESKELDELFAHRDFLKAEGDRHHNAFVAEKEKANAIHEKTLELMKQVVEVRDLMKAERVERKSWIDDHNAAVDAEMRSGAESEEVASDLIETLMGKGNLTLGGTLEADSSEVQQKQRRSVKKSNRKISPSRKR